MKSLFALFLLAALSTSAVVPENQSANATSVMNANGTSSGNDTSSTMTLFQALFKASPLRLDRFYSALFHRLDDNKDGGLDRKEFYPIAEQLPLGNTTTPGLNSSEAAFRKLDQDGNLSLYMIIYY
jgi:hypothetical protein